MIHKQRLNVAATLIIVLVVSSATIGCAPDAFAPDSSPATSQGEGTHGSNQEAGQEHQQANGVEGESLRMPTEDILALPELQTIDLNGGSLQVVATTSIIGDVVAQVGGDRIALTTLMGPGQDPHSYVPAVQDLTAASTAHVIFVNGWDLEEALVGELENIGEGVPLVPISANIIPLAFGEAEHDHEEGEEEHEHSGADPHVWLSIPNVKQWVKNVENVLVELDPANAEFYRSQAAEYLDELDAVDEYARTRLAQIPEDKRLLVTNHDSYRYFAEEYGFEILGAVIPGGSTLVEPSAADLASLVNQLETHEVCAIFTETTLSDTIARTVADELDACEDVQVLALYVGSIGPTGSGADSYITMFRYNVDTVVRGLQ